MGHGTTGVGSTLCGGGGGIGGMRGGSMGVGSYDNGGMAGICFTLPAEPELEDAGSLDLGRVPTNLNGALTCLERSSSSLCGSNVSLPNISAIIARSAACGEVNLAELVKSLACFPQSRGRFR